MRQTFLREVLAQFKTSEFWVAMMLIAFFGVLTYFLVHFSFLTDNLLISIKGARCLPLNNRSVLFLFFSMVFFGLSALLMLGELQNYFNFKAQKNTIKASKALGFSALWGFFSTGIASAVLIFYSSICW